jgi:hypothetical protein
MVIAVIYQISVSIDACVILQNDINLVFVPVCGIGVSIGIEGKQCAKQGNDDGFAHSNPPRIVSISDIFRNQSDEIK